MIRFADIATDLQSLQVRQYGVRVIAFIGDHLANLLDPFVPAVGFLRRCFELLGRLGQRLRDRRRVALIGALQRHRHDRARFQIHRMLDFVR